MTADDGHRPSDREVEQRFRASQDAADARRRQRDAVAEAVTLALVVCASIACVVYAAVLLATT